MMAEIGSASRPACGAACTPSSPAGARQVGRGSPRAPALLTAPFGLLLRRRCRAAGLLAPDRVFGLRWSGRMTRDRLSGLIRHLPDGLNEIYVHPATGTFAGAAVGYHYREEFEALMAPDVVAACRNSSLRLGGFGDFLDPAPACAAACAGHAHRRIDSVSAYASMWPEVRFASAAMRISPLPDAAGHLNPYKPAVIDWPKLDAATRDRLVSLPIWDVAVQTEGRARLNVASYASAVSDSLLRKAIELNAFEEGRHKRVLSNLVAAYGIALAPEPHYAVTGDPEWAFMVTGYSECIDSFFAFGLFESAKRSGFFPEALVDTFEPVIQEEARHILFFVNWAAWHRRTMPLWRRPYFELKVLAVWLFLIWERIGIARDVGNGVQDNNFTVTGAKQVGDDINVRQLIDLCLAKTSGA